MRRNRSENEIQIVFGASSGIGFAFTELLLNESSSSQIFATYRKTSDQEPLQNLSQKYPSRLNLMELEGTSDSDFSSFVQKLDGLRVEKVDLILNCIGVLTIGELGPERKAEELTRAGHLQIYENNVVPSLLIGKYFRGLLRASDYPRFFSISAKVGSITDNNIGGWYSYRMAKASLNMFMKTFSRELGRFNKNALVVSLHPGTTETKLSEPFMETAKKKYKIHTPKDTAKNLWKLISQLQIPGDNGTFYSWDGEKLPW